MKPISLLKINIVKGGRFEGVSGPLFGGGCG